MTEAPRRIIWARRQSTCGSIIFPERPPQEKKERDYVYHHPVADGRVGEMPVRYLSRGLARQSTRRQSYCGLRDGEIPHPGDPEDLQKGLQIRFAVRDFRERGRARGHKARRGIAQGTGGKRAGRRGEGGGG